MSEPWSEQYRLAAKDWVDKHAAAELLEETKSATLAQKVQPLIKDGMAVNKAEIQVKASDEWHEYLEEMVAARKAANLARVRMSWTQMKFKEEESKNYTRRAEMGLSK